MNNTTTMTINEYGNTIIDNRYIANAQLTADDMGVTSWKQYRQLCDNIAIAAWDSLRKKIDDNVLGLSLSGLFAFFGSDLKATPDKQKRILLACVTMKKEQSVPMKKARKALREAKKALEEAQASDDKQNIDALQASVDEAQAEVDRLASEPGNVWYNPVPMLDTTKKHASTKCRKYIEDTIADMIKERSLMTVEELQAEALRLAAERKARKQAKAQAEANK